VEEPQGPGGALKVGAFFRTITLAPTLNLLMTEGHARLLSSPDLVTVPGNNATFLVGGSIPIPFSTGLGQVSIQYQTFGVQLNVTPTLLGNGAVEAKIQPEVSDLDFQDGVQENGFLIPALKTSKLSTDIITQPGESIIMGGMVRRVEQRFIQKVPLLGDIPILGQLFRSTNYQNNQSDVVFVMTPQVITR
jgi:pilus assembly protein CpaC